MKLRKLVINDWVHLFPRVVSLDSRRMVGGLNDMYLFWGFLWGGAHKCRKLGSDIGRNINFFKNNSVELSTCDGSIEAVKYILIGFSHKTAEIHSLCIQLIN